MKPSKKELLKDIGMGTVIFLFCLFIFMLIAFKFWVV